MLDLLTLYIISSFIVDLSCIGTPWSRPEWVEPRKNCGVFFLCCFSLSCVLGFDLAGCRDRKQGGFHPQHSCYVLFTSIYHIGELLVNLVGAYIYRLIANYHS